MNQYFLIEPETMGAYIYIATEENNQIVNVDRITHCFYDDFFTLISILIKEKEVYKFKIFKHTYQDYVLAKLNNINNIEIEVIESI